MKTIAKVLFKTLLWLVLIVVLLSLIGKGINTIKDKFNLNFGNKETVKVDDLGNGMGSHLFGDLTPEEVEEIRQDLNAPTIDDVFQDFMFVDLGDYVVVYRNATNNVNTSIIPNALFVKTKNGLVWDGNLGLTADIKTNWWNGSHDFENIKFTQTYTNYSNKDESVALNVIFFLFNSGLGAEYENIVTFSDFKASFAPNFYNMNGLARVFMNEQNELNKLQNVTRRYLLENVVAPYFLNLDTAKLYLDGSTMTEEELDAKGISLLNSYMTFLYNNVKDIEDENARYISLNDYFVVPIPAKDIEKYPIAEEDKAKYNNRNYYLAYDCNIVAECYYKKQEANIERDKVVVGENTTKVEIADTPTEAEILTKLNLTLVNKNNSDLSKADLKTNPVTITIGDDVIVYDSVNELSKEIALKKNTTYNYTITSNSFVFNSYSGSFTLTNNNQVLEIPFEFDYNYVETNIKLMPVSSVSSDDYDLSTNPVNIIFTGNNGEGIYQFVYSSNDEILTTKSMKLKKGSYSYSIESTDLIFTSTAGNVVVDENNRNFTFSYTSKSTVMLENIKLFLTQEEFTSSQLNFTLNSDVHNEFVNTFENVESVLYNLSCVTSDNKILWVREQELNVSTSETMFYTLSNYDYVEGDSYYLKLSLSDSKGNCFSSNTLSFVYYSNLKYILTYTIV